MLVDNCFGLCTILQVPDVDLNIRFGGWFDNARLRSQCDIVENMGFSNDTLDDVRSNRGICLVLKVRKTNNL